MEQETTTRRYYRLHERNERELAAHAVHMIGSVLEHGARRFGRSSLVGEALLLDSGLRAYADRLEISAVLREVTS